MNWVIYLFGSGAAFFVGIGIILAGLGIFVSCQRAILRIVATLLPMAGMLLIAASAMPLPYWAYASAGAATFVWLIAERITRGWLFERRRYIRGLMLAAWFIAVAIELPFQFVPVVEASGSPTLYIIGDSVTAGMGGEKTTWPRLLAKAHPVQIVDLSRAGATAHSALRQADGLPEDGGLLLVEIGGNDVLGSTSAAKFAADLERLLRKVHAPGRTLVMFELPLPPFCNEYGLSQRRLASEYGVVLIPRRVFASVLTSGDATLDSVHLAPSGHERMADVVWALIQSAYAPS